MSVAGGDNLKPVLQYLALGIWLGVVSLCTLVFLAAVLSQRDSELAGDESTLKQLGDTHRISYGMTLIEMMTAPASHSDFLSLATTMSGSKPCCN